MKDLRHRGYIYPTMLWASICIWLLLSCSDAAKRSDANVPVEKVEPKGGAPENTDCSYFDGYTIAAAPAIYNREGEELQKTQSRLLPWAEVRLCVSAAEKERFLDAESDLLLNAEVAGIEPNKPDYSLYEGRIKSDVVGIPSLKLTMFHRPGLSGTWYFKSNNTDARAEIYFDGSDRVFFVLHDTRCVVRTSNVFCEPYKQQERSYIGGTYECRRNECTSTLDRFYGMHKSTFSQGVPLKPTQQFQIRFWRCGPKALCLDGMPLAHRN